LYQNIWLFLLSQRKEGGENYIKERAEHFRKYGWKSFIFIQDELNET